MTKPFLNEDFLLQNDIAKTLYHDYAAAMPIFDYHNHLNPQEIYEDKQFENIAKLWLGGDHYKWRILRSNGVDEDYITGSQTDEAKFKAFAKTIPYTIGNPMYHWTHLELQRYFGITELLSEETADRIYKRCNELLQEKPFSVRNLIKRSNVEALCTTDDPVDDLKYHKLLAEEQFDVKVLPTFRPDQVIHIEKIGFKPYLEKIQALGYSTASVKDIITFLEERMDYFHENKCRLADHGLDSVQYLEATYDEVEAVYQKALSGVRLSQDELRQYKGYLLAHLGKCYHKRKWVCQYHIGAMRNNATRMFDKLGADAGFDSIHDAPVAQDLSRLLDSMDKTDELPKVILYCLNPADNAVLATMIGNFQGSGIPGKVQFGSGWWFMDTKAGMIKQMEDLAAMGLLARFVGMLTDSRSFLSFPRHEYFRRILCNEIGKLVVNGEYPADMARLGEIVQGICYHNINHYIE